MKIYLLVLLLLLPTSLHAADPAAQTSMQCDAATGTICTLPPGNYSAPLRLTKPRTNLFAWGAKVSAVAGRDGLIIDPSATQCHVEGLWLTSVGTSSVVGAGVGVRQNGGRLHASDLLVERFGQNWRCDSLGGGSCNGSLIERVSLYRSDLDGMYLSGGNANAITTVGLDLKGACWRKPSQWFEFVQPALASNAPPALNNDPELERLDPISTWTLVPVGAKLLTGTVYHRRVYDCAGLNDNAFLGNTHVGLVVHLTYSGGTAAPRKFPAFMTTNGNAQTLLLGPYCETDSAASRPQALTTVFGGNCDIAPGMGWVLRPSEPFMTPAQYGGPLVLGSWLPGAARMRVSVGKVLPTISIIKDPWQLGDVFIYSGSLPVGKCRYNTVTTVNQTTAAVTFGCTKDQP